MFLSVSVLAAGMRSAGMRSAGMRSAGMRSAGTHAHYSTIHTLMLPAEENPCLAIHAWGKYKTRGEAGKYHKTIRELAFEVRACEVRAHAITARQGGRPQ